MIYPIEFDGCGRGNTMKRSRHLQEKEKKAKLLKKITFAESRLRNKLLQCDLNALGISEYNRRYLGNKMKEINNVLELYGHLLLLTFYKSSTPVQRSVFVDYGGGIGILSMLAKEMGVGMVIYNDIYDVSCNDVKLVSSALGLPLDHIVYGDIGDLLSYVEKNMITVNVIVSSEVLEHIYDVESHFRQLSSLSKCQFRVVYASGANIENLRCVHHIKKRQIEFEHKNRKKEWGHKERDTLRAFFDVRKDMISAYAPELSHGQVEWLSRSTRGLIKSQIEKSVAEYLIKGYIDYHPTHPTNTCDPYTGNWCEHLINLKWIKDVLQDAGFEVKILPGYYSTQGSLVKRNFKIILNKMIYLLGRKGMFISPYYVVYANRLN